MKVIGVDLAGLAKNPTGVCVLSEEDGVKTVSTRLVYSDEEIIQIVGEVMPDVVAIDAPLIYAGQNRLCDRELQEFGALPVTLSGMECLAKRGARLNEVLSPRHKLVEVYAKGSAKILGLYHKDDFTCQKKLLELDLCGDVSERILFRDELDAVFAAFTGLLFLIGQVREVGGEDGIIIVPDV